MLNMLNPFFKKISEILFDFFQSELRSAGERYFLQLDHDSDVQKLINALKECPSKKQFIYKHELGEIYETFSIEFNNLKLVIASTSPSVKPDFLVTLRNQVGEQKGSWKKTALLSIVSSQLDSIQGGSSDLQKEGMPLHSKSIVTKIEKEIENSTFNKIEQTILQNHIKLTLQEQIYQKINFFDFEEIFSILTNGNLNDNNYKSLGLFRDNELDTYKGTALEYRIEQNRYLFDFVKNIHDFNLDFDDLEKKFTSKMREKLEKENWYEYLFPEIINSHEEQKKKNNTKLEIKSIASKEGLEIWNKPLKETKAGGKKRHIIIFNPEKLDSINLNVSFLIEGGHVNNLQKKYIKQIGYYANTDIKSNILQISFSGIKTTCIFSNINYRHDLKTVLGVELNISVIPIKSEIFNLYKTSYLINVKENFISLQYEGEEFRFGNELSTETIEVTKSEQEIKLPLDKTLIIQPQSEAFNDDETLALNITYDDIKIPIKLVNELPDSIPITALRIWKLKRENKKSFEQIKDRLMFGNREFYINSDYKQFFEWESEWVRQSYTSALYESGKLIPINLNLDKNLQERYIDFVNQFNNLKNIPSLTFFNDKLIEKAENYINSYLKVVDSFSDIKEVGKNRIDLFNLGIIKANNVIYLTPFHPLVVAYQLQVNKNLINEEIENNILNRLQPDALLPFIFDTSQKDCIYKPEPQNRIIEWMIYKPANQVSVSEANKYLAKIVEDKLNQFEEHFSYLFTKGSQAPLKINIIQIENDTEVLRGIIYWMLKTVERKGLEELRNIEITLYRDNKTESSFDRFSRIESLENFQKEFSIPLSSKKYDTQDIIRIIRKKINYYKSQNNTNYNYAHISFYKMLTEENYALQSMNEMMTGIALDGLYSFVPAVSSDSIYKSGFGIKGYSIDKNNLLMSTAYYLNELSANLKDSGNNTYHKSEAIFSRTTASNKATLGKIFDSSYWVTFLDSNINLEFFNNYQNLIIIHYSDQYSTTSKYDAITVTDKSEQYYAVIKEVLQEKNVTSDEYSINNTIKAFNTFNGEWLLRIIGSKGHYAREKLSIISAIKFSLAYFDHPNILWVPISLEEILRIAGTVNLNKSEGVFTAKNLGISGAHSDDLLLIGLENSNSNIKLHFYPIEVKIGLNNTSTLQKANLQVSKTKDALINALTNKYNPFTSLFYRYFFAHLLIVNAQKLYHSGFWEDKKTYNLPLDTIEKLLKDNFEIANNFNNYIGDGAILSFQKDAYIRSSKLDGNTKILQLTEDDGYEGLTKSMVEMWEWIQNRNNGLIKENMLSFLYKPLREEHSEYVESSDIKNYVYPEEKTNLSNLEQKFYNEKKDFFPVNNSLDTNLIESISNKLNSNLLEEVRILIGTAENSTESIYWEYGNKELANRHLLISGKSGQGKTYLIQCMLLELSKKGISSLIIDYTEGFLPKQLEPEFSNYLGEKLIQRIVYNEKIPMNPFKKNMREIGGIILPENNTDIAERVKSIFSSVYKSLGIQQLNAIYDAVLNGLQLYDSNFTLSLLKEILDAENSTSAKTALSQIRPLIDRDPFINSDFINWEKILSNEGNVYIVQLTGYPRDVQLILAEFILWDLWNYSVNNGDKNNPIPIILDEAQNLDHNSGSPSTKILTEGRKFGWSGWFATQFLKSQLGNDQLSRLQNATQKLYFSQPEQENSYIASNLSNEYFDKKKLEQKISGLKKGQCIFNGPILNKTNSLSSSIVQVVNITPLKDRI